MTVSGVPEIGGSQAGAAKTCHDSSAENDPARSKNRGQAGSTEADPIILDAYAAGSCPVKTQNRFDPTLSSPTSATVGALAATSEALQEAFGGAAAYVAHMQEMLAQVPGAVDLREPSATGHNRDAAFTNRTFSAREAALRATEHGVAAGVPLIVAPVLPIDLAGHRSGQPDALLRAGNRPDGQPGYVPVVIKRRRILERNRAATPIWCSFPTNPMPACAFETHDVAVRNVREANLLQLAHHWRTLQGAGWAAGGVPTGGLLGTDRIDRPDPRGDQAVAPVLLPASADGGQPVIVWIDLSAKTIRTFSRTAAEHWRSRSPLERYDHEFSFRLKVAEVARRRNSDSDDPRPVVFPIVVPECDYCQWWSWCRPMLGEDDLSLRINKSRLDVREISVLRTMGIATLNDLANADLDALLPRYLPEVTHRPGAEDRLRLAARRSVLLSNGIELERHSCAPIDLPPGHPEIDFDIETAPDDRIYLWGFLIDDPATQRPVYRSFARFSELDDAGELELASQAMTWLVNLLDAYPDARVYHYSDYERQHIRKVAAMAESSIDNSTGAPIGEARASAALGNLIDSAVLARAVQASNDRFTDLFSLVRAHFFGAHGLGLKVVAHAGAGFSWRDDDPGGLNSQQWFADAVHADDPATRAAARQRVLDYNEDDVRATHALRAWLRTLS